MISCTITIDLGAKGRRHKKIKCVVLAMPTQSLHDVIGHSDNDACVHFINHRAGYLYAHFTNEQSKLNLRFRPINTGVNPRI